MSSSVRYGRLKQGPGWPEVCGEAGVWQYQRPYGWVAGEYSWRGDIVTPQPRTVADPMSEENKLAGIRGIHQVRSHARVAEW